MQLFVKRSVTRAQVVQFLEYFVGGMAYFWVGYAVFAICYSGFRWRWLYAKMLADIIGWTINYLIQRYWAFSNKKLQHHDGSILGKYGLITLVNLFFDYLMIAGLNAIGISPYLGFFISAGFFTVWNYIWYRFWVFIGKK
jgi:putative flippase GtrA